MILGFIGKIDFKIRANRKNKYKIALQTIAK